MMAAMNDEDDEWPGVGAVDAMGATAGGFGRSLESGRWL